MKIGIVGAGNIAQKAYLPIYAQMQDRYAFIISSRELERAQGIVLKFGFGEAVAGVDALVEAGVGAAFVHVATSLKRPKSCWSPAYPYAWINRSANL